MIHAFYPAGLCQSPVEINAQPLVAVLVLQLCSITADKKNGATDVILVMLPTGI